VDWGGTHLRVVGLDRRARKIFHLTQTAPPPSGLPSVLASLWKRKRLNPLPVLVLGGKGIWKPEVRRSWQKRLQSLARRTIVLSDVEIAHKAALGGEAGVLILAGTGSIALGTSFEKKWARAGGLGPRHGDEGSGFWIGCRYRGRVTANSPKQVRDTAKFASVVMAKAKRRDPRCLLIIQEAQGHLARLIADTAGRLFKKGVVPVSWAGGLMEERFFRAGVFRQARNLLSLSGLQMKTLTPRREPVEAAALYGLELSRSR